MVICAWIILSYCFHSTQGIKNGGMCFDFQASDSSGIGDAMSNRDTNAITPMHAAAVNGDKSSLVKLIAGV